MNLVINMNGYEKRTKVKKDAIIHAAGELFTERGITDVGISEIAAKAKVSQVTIYNYFGNKNTLAKNVLVSYLDGIITEYEEILERNVPFLEKLEIIMSKKHEAIIEAGRSNFSRLAWEDKTLQQVFRDIAATKAISIYFRFIEMGKNEGAIDKSIPSDAILAFLLSSIAMMQDPDYFKSTNEYKMGILRLFLYGFLGKK